MSPSAARIAGCIAAGLLLAAGAARADSVDTLRAFVRDVKTGRAAFTQVVTPPDGARKKTSSGTFEFSRPNRFRFSYQKPYEQQIVADGEKVWFYDVDLNQVTVRTLDAALGATPAALLAGGSLDADFNLTALPSKDGIDWAQAMPKAKDGSFQQLRIGFRGKDLAALEIVDSFGQQSQMSFSAVAQGVELPAQTFVFKPPAGAAVVQQ